LHRQLQSGITRFVGGQIDPRSDEQLVRDINAGDSSSFDVLYWRYRDWVVGLAYRFTLHHDDSLDVLQETFSYVARKFPGFELRAAMKTFLYPVVRNLSIEIRKKRRRMTHGETIFDTVPAPPIPGDSRSELAIVLSGLPDTHREVLLLRFVDGLKLEEIADALEVPLGTVKSRLHNALEQLRGDPRLRSYFEAK
jgi:RNA polymerase sigma-70 factor, ECF subfamily